MLRLKQPLLRVKQSRPLLQSGGAISAALAWSSALCLSLGRCPAPQPMPGLAPIHVLFVRPLRSLPFLLGAIFVELSLAGEESHCKIKIGMVTLRPRFGRLIFPLPFQRGSKSAPCHSCSFAPRNFSGFGQTLVNDGGFGFFVDPLLQPLPDANQTLVRDVNQRVVSALRLCREASGMNGLIGGKFR